MSKWPKWFEWPEWPGWPKWPKWPGWLDDRNLRRQLTVFLWSIHGLSVVKKEPIWPIWLLTSDFMDPEAGTCLPTSRQSSTVAKRCICPFIRTLVISSLLFLFPNPAPGMVEQCSCSVKSCTHQDDVMLMDQKQWWVTWTNQDISSVWGSRYMLRATGHTFFQLLICYYVCKLATNNTVLHFPLF